MGAGMYYQGQTLRLGTAERYAIKLENRDEQHPERDSATHWLIIGPDQFHRIADILAEGDDVYEIQPSDVGKAFLRAFGQTWPVEDFLGQVLPRDVGKRVHKVPSGDDFILQVENDEQRAARLTR